MKNLFLISVLLLLPLSIFSQDNKVKELGIIFDNLDSYGLTYRWGQSNSLWRLSGIVGEGYNYKASDSDEDLNEGRFSIGADIGKEKRKRLTEQLFLRLGGQVNAEYYSYKRDTSMGSDEEYVNKYATVGANFILGFCYINKSNFVFGAEFLPGVSYMWGKIGNESDIAEPYDVARWKIGGSSNAARISIAYQF